MEQITMICNGAWSKLGLSLATMFGAKPAATKEITCPLCKGHFPMEVKGISKLDFDDTPDMNPFKAKP